MLCSTSRSTLIPYTTLFRSACTCKDNLGRTTAQGNFLVSLSSYMPEYPDDFLFSYLITAEVSHRYSGRKLHYCDHAHELQTFRFTRPDCSSPCHPVLYDRMIVL